MKLAHLILERKGKNIGADILITYNYRFIIFPKTSCGQSQAGLIKWTYEFRDTSITFSNSIIWSNKKVNKMLQILYFVSDETEKIGEIKTKCTSQY